MGGAESTAQSADGDMVGENLDPNNGLAAEVTSVNVPARRCHPGEEVATRALLERHGIATSGYGVGSRLCIADLTREVADGLCELVPNDAGDLVRHVSLVEVSLIALLPTPVGGVTSRLVLVEEEQVLDDGRRRPRRPRRLHGKLRAGEAPLAGARRALQERLGIGDNATVTEFFATAAEAATDVGSAGTGEAACSLDSSAAQVIDGLSESYPGLTSRYSVHRVELRLPACASCGAACGEHSTSEEGSRAAGARDHSDLLSRFGLPSGRSFLTVEGQLGEGCGGRTHLWRWTLEEAPNVTEKRRRNTESSAGADAESSSDTEDSDTDEGDLTNLEQVQRDITSVHHLLTGLNDALAYENAVSLKVQLSAAEDRLKRVLKNVTDIEGLAHASANRLTPKGRRMSKSLCLFIKNNFLDGASTKDLPPEMVAARLSEAGHPLLGAGYGSPRGSGGGSGGSGGSGSFLAVAGGEMQAMQIIASEVEGFRQQDANQCWAFDALALSDRTNRAGLLVMAELICVPHSAELGTSKTTMRRYCAELHRRYEEHPNAFHNEAHASIVCHSTHWLAVRGRSWSSQSLWLRAATDLAALSHDVGHFGRNNAFCVNQPGNELALIYNDRSILENMHAATAFQIMSGASCNILQDSSLENRKQFRDHVVDLILATDMASHFDFLGKFRVRSTCAEFCPQENAEDRRMVNRCYIKAADLGHATLPFEMHERWAMRLLIEFYEQGDEERSLGLPISPMCERGGNVGEFRESQKGFLRFVILPLYKELATVTFPEVGETCITQLEGNAEDWVKKEPSKALADIVNGIAEEALLDTSPPSSPKRLSRITETPTSLLVDAPSPKSAKRDSECQTTPQ